MSRHFKPFQGSPRLIASAVGVAITSLSAAQMAQAAEAEDNAVTLGATSVTEKADTTSYKTETSASNKYTAPLR